jgi:FkbM family methyltransferase
VKIRIDTMKDGVRIVVPDELNVMTSYVLAEQGDWAEPELELVRSLVQPGETVVDVGAGFGAYSLPMAARVGPHGAVIAFEAGRRTASFLARSIEENGFSWLQLHELALSDEEGETDIASIGTPELGELSPKGTFHPSSVAVETVRTRPFAAFANVAQSASFDRLGTLGSTVAMVAGAGDFFDRADPLVQLEPLIGREPRTALVDAFVARGYEMYRLVPGLGVMERRERAPGLSEPSSKLWAAKPSRAELLEQRGFLSRTARPDLTLDRSFGARWFEHLAYRNRIRGRDVPASIAWFAMAKGSDDAATRVTALGNALELAGRDARDRPTIPRRLTFVRIALEAGFRTVADAGLRALVQDIDIDLVESEAPFLAPVSRFDNIAAVGSIGGLMAAATVEALLTGTQFSGFVVGPEQLGYYDAYQTFPYPNEELRRRYELARARLGIRLEH